MSPEQARGKPVDKRADIWAFGAVLYQMLTRQRAFRGEDTSETLAAVLRQEVDWAGLPPPRRGRYNNQEAVKLAAQVRSLETTPAPPVPVG